MKKVLVALFLGIFAFIAIGISSYAVEAGTGNLVVHFQAWEGDYEGLGSHAWGGPAAGKLHDGVDDFGVYYEFNDIPVGTEVGFIAVYWEGEGPNWDRKLTGDIFIDPSAVVEGETTHVYVFEGAATTDDDPGHYIARNDAPNMLTVYYDPSGAYEEELGVHAWGWEGYGSEWGNPSQVFTKGGVAASGYDVKAAMLYAEEDGAGLLVYAGGDANKKTGDVTIANAMDEFLNGEVGVAYVVSKGNAYTANDNVFYNDPATFSEMAFSFQLMPFDNEEKDGTYAVDPTTIIVKTSSPVASPYPDAEDKEEATATIEGWFAVHEVLGEGTYSEDPLAIERVDFAANDTLTAFVIILAEGSELDNSKDYELFFDLGLEEGNAEASIPVDLDREAPVLNFISPSGIVGLDPEDRVIEVTWGQPFDQNLFPRFRVDDNRDGDLTSFVFVPKGGQSVLDTREEGDYTILLRVEDEWGNVTDETFIFRVSKTE